MPKTNLKFIFEMIEGHIRGYMTDYHEGLLTLEQLNHRMTALETFSKSLKSFIADANTLTGGSNEN